MWSCVDLFAWTTLQLRFDAKTFVGGSDMLLNTAILNVRLNHLHTPNDITSTTPAVNF